MFMHIKIKYLLGSKYHSTFIKALNTVDNINLCINFSMLFLGTY